MKKTKSTVIAAAVSGILMGGMSSCQLPSAQSVTLATDVAEKHACKTLNTCKNKGGCKSAGGCAGKNACSGKGGCATVPHHSCGGKNSCKNLGGCGGTAGKNECKGKGGCHVPIKH
jgi:hypothetical protein